MNHALSARRSVFAGILVAIVLSTASYAHAQVRGTNAESERAAARRAAIGSARAQLEAAQARMKAAEDRVKAEAKANPDQTAAQTELDQAQAELDRLSGPVLERLRNDPAYQAVLRDEEDAARVLREQQAKAVAEQPASTRPADTTRPEKPEDGITQADEEQKLNVPIPTDGQMVAAVDKLDVRSKRREMELAAIAADASSGPAQARVDAATAKLKQYRAEFDAKLLNDPEYKAARDALAAARAEVTRAAAANY